MENNFDNREFEQFLKQNADQYRMFPSEKVWNGIHHTLHNRRKRTGLVLLLLTLTAATVSLVMLSKPAKQKQVSYVQESSVKSPAPEANKSVSGILNPVIETNRLSNSVSVIPSQNNSYTLDSFTGVTNNPTNISNKEVNETELIFVETKTPVNKLPPVEVNKEELTDLPVNIYFNDQATDNNPDFLTHSSQSNGADNELKKVVQKNIYPMSIESVVNSFRQTAKKKITLQAYFTPTISYRKLSGNNSFINAANNTSLGIVYSYDVNKAVTHKPGLGLELGISARYAVSNNIKIKGGVQFNVRRYEIKAFNYSGEVATIALNQGAGVSSISTWTKYRNFNGYSPNWLQNYYFSISAPVGAEFKIGENKKRSFGVAGTIQPTYVLNDRAYLITTDFKNYAEIPSLIRRWNVNASLEAFVNYSTGKINWRLGPQVRYQMLSSFQNKYPVKENLYDYGLKVGIMLNQ